jgi:hypothetical protein
MPIDASTRLFSPAQITVASLIGGPLPACLLIAHNYRKLGEHRLRLWWAFGGVIGEIVVLAVVLIVTPDRLPPYVLPIAYSIAFRETAKRLQGAAIKQHREAGGRLGSWSVVIGLGVLGLILVFAVVFLLPSSMIPRPKP